MRVQPCSQVSHLPTLPELRKGRKIREPGKEADARISVSFKWAPPPSQCTLNLICKHNKHLETTTRASQWLEDVKKYCLKSPYSCEKHTSMRAGSCLRSINQTGIATSTKSSTEPVNKTVTSPDYMYTQPDNFTGQRLHVTQMSLLPG